MPSFFVVVFFPDSPRVNQNAVVDQFRESGQQRPSVNTEHPDLPLVVYLDRGRALLYRSLSGTRSMHKRGYRNAMHAASLKENVAAGLLLASGWDSETQSLADPMCGSGTLVIEAALIAMRRAPGLVAMGAFSGEINERMCSFIEEVMLALSPLRADNIVTAKSRS